MSTASLETGPVLVSDLPPVTLVPGILDVLRARFVAARERRALDRAIRLAGPTERNDLYAQARRV
ncbi:MAG: hypothetical protein ABR549_08085 [Mycobacteriales bacterium]